MFIDGFASVLSKSRRTVCAIVPVGDTRAEASVDSAWEQKKLEARKMLENAAESHTSGARFVGTLLMGRLLLISMIMD